MPSVGDSQGSVKLICLQEHFYDPIKGGGYLENRLKTMRKRMSPEGKAYKKRRNATKRKNESDTEFKRNISIQGKQ